MAESFYRSFDLPVAMIRPFNTYGPRQSARAVIPTIAAQVVGGAGEDRPRRPAAGARPDVRHRHGGGLHRRGRPPTSASARSPTSATAGASRSATSRASSRRWRAAGHRHRRGQPRLRPPQSEVFELIAGTDRARERCGWEPHGVAASGPRRGRRLRAREPGPFRRGPVRGMRAIILAGGRGTRLRPFTTSFPKPLMPVGDIPILEILLRQLKAHGVTDVTLLTGHLAYLLEGYFERWLASWVCASTTCARSSRWARRGRCASWRGPWSTTSS